MADKFELRLDTDKAIKKRGLNENGRVQQFIDSECLRRCNDDYVPFDQYSLIASSFPATQIGSGKIKWNTPYARRLYYHPEYNFSQEHNAHAGGYWFEHMKQQYREQILAGAKRIAGGNA